MTVERLVWFVWPKCDALSISGAEVEHEGRLLSCHKIFETYTIGYLWGRVLCSCVAPKAPYTTHGVGAGPPLAKL